MQASLVELRRAARRRWRALQTKLSSASTRCASLFRVVDTVGPFVKYVAASTWIASEGGRRREMYTPSAI